VLMFCGVRICEGLCVAWGVGCVVFAVSCGVTICCGMHGEVLDSLRDDLRYDDSRCGDVRCDDSMYDDLRYGDFLRDDFFVWREWSY
jgi:hypothetical protein